MLNAKVAILRPTNPSNPATKEEIKNFLIEVVDETFAHGNVSEDFWIVIVDEDMKDCARTNYARFIAITGNGPNSKKHAHEIAAFPDLLRISMGLNTTLNNENLTPQMKIDILQDYKIKLNAILGKIANQIE